MDRGCDCRGRWGMAAGNQEHLRCFRGGVQRFVAEPQTFDARQAQLGILYEQGRSAAHEGPIREMEAYEKLSLSAARSLRTCPIV